MTMTTLPVMMNMATECEAVDAELARYCDVRARDFEASFGYTVPADEDMATCW